MQSDVAFAFVTVSIVYFQHLIIFAVKHTFYTKITEVHFLWFIKFYVLSFYNFFREKKFINEGDLIAWLFLWFSRLQIDLRQVWQGRGWILVVWWCSKCLTLLRHAVNRGRATGCSWWIGQKRYILKIIVQTLSILVFNRQRVLWNVYFHYLGDGLITLEEFVSVMNSHKSIFSKKDEKDLEFREVFRILDKSGTGRVTKQALCEFMSEFEPSFDEEHAFELMTQFDTMGNGDLCYEGNRFGCFLFTESSFGSSVPELAIPKPRFG